MTDPVTLLDRALAQTATILDRASGAHPAAPTPCRNWSLARLVNHLVFDTTQFQASASGGTPDWSLKPPPVPAPYGPPFRAGATALLEAWRAAGDTDRIVKLPIGERPLSFVIMQQTAEFAVHGWDVATATAQRVTWDEEVAAEALAWAKTTLLPEFRGEDRPFGPPVEIEDTAPVQDRLVAWFGRTPS